MSYLQDIYAALTGNITIAGLLTSRIYQNVADVDAVEPYAVIQIINETQSTTHSGPGQLDFIDLQISIWSKQPLTSITVSNSVDAALNCQTLSGGNQTHLIRSNRIGTHDETTKLHGIVTTYRLSTIP